MATNSSELRITLHPYDRRVPVKIGSTLLADTTYAIELREHDYPLHQYIHGEDVPDGPAAPLRDRVPLPV